MRIHGARSARFVLFLIASLVASVVVPLSSAPASAVEPGTVAGTVAGTVTVPGGSPALDGYVSAYDGDYNWLDDAWVDETGYYEFGSLPEGDVYLSLASFSNGIGGWYDSASDFYSATAVTVTAGDTTTIDVELEAPASLSGTVTVPGGGAALDGCVTAYDWDYNWLASGCVDGSGFYELGGLSAGDVYLEFASFSNGAGEWYDGASDLYSATAVTLTAGSATTLDVELAQAATVSGTVTMAGGALALNGYVAAYDSDYNNLGSTWVEAGAYEIAGLPAGDVYLEFYHFDGAVDVWYEGAGDLNAATPVTLTGGATTTVDVELAEGATLAGTVTVPGGGPALDGYIDVYDENHDYLGDAWVDESGYYELDGVPAGDVYLRFSSFSNAASQWYDGASDFYTATPVTLTAGSTTTVDAELAEGATLAGTVTVPGGGAALDGYIDVYDEDFNNVGMAWVDESGYYELGGLTGGDVYLRLAEFSNGVDQWFDGASGFYSATPVTLSTGSTTTVDVELAEGATLAGAITVPGGGPALDGCVHAYDADYNSLGSECVDSSGNYEFDSLPAGDVYLQFQYFSNGASQWYDGASDFYTATPVTLTGSSTTTLDVELLEGATLAGTVTVPGGGAALDGYIDVYGENGDYLGDAWVDENGYFELGGLPAGDVYLRFWSFSNAAGQWYDGASDIDSATPVTLSAGSTTTVDAELPVAGAISGTVTVAGGDPAVNGSISAYDENYDWVGNTWVEAGAYEITGLPTGDIYLEFTDFSNGVSQWYDGASDFYSATPVAVTGGATTTLDVELAVGATVSGTVTVAGEAPGVDGYVYAYDADYNWLGSAWVEWGSYEIGGLPAGDVYLRFTDFSNGVGEWYDDASSFYSATPVTVTSGSTTAVDVDLAAGATISGNLTVPGGDAAVGGWVYAYGADYNWLGDAWVDETGYYELTGLPESDVYLEFSEFSNAVSEWYDGASSFNSATPIAVVDGETTTLDVELEPAATIVGTVTVPGGDAALYGCVYAYDIDQNRLSSGCVDETGFYELGGLPSGDVYLSFRWFSNGTDEWFDGTNAFSEATPVAVVAGTVTTVDNELPEGAEVTVSLTVPEVNAPPLGIICVQLETVDGDSLGDAQWCGESLDDLPATFAHVPPGDFIVRVFPDIAEEGAATPIYQGGSNVPSGAQVFSVSDGGSLSVTVDLPQTGSIAGTVSRDDGEVESYTGAVYLYTQGGGDEWELVPCSECGGYDPLPSKMTNGDGEFLAKNLVPGDYKVGYREYSSNTVYAPEGTTGPTIFYGGATDLADAQVITVSAGTVTNGDMVLPSLLEGWTLTGTILDSEGSPAVGEDIVFAYDGGGGDAITDSSGEFSVQIPDGMSVAIYQGENIFGTLLDLVDAPSTGSAVAWSFSLGDPVFELAADNVSLTAAGGGESLWRRVDPVGKDTWLWGELTPTASVEFAPGEMDLVSVSDVTGDGLADAVVHRGVADGADVWRVFSFASGTEFKKFFGPEDVTGLTLGDVTGDGVADVVAYQQRIGKAAKLWMWDVVSDELTLHYSGWSEITGVYVAQMTGDGVPDVVLQRARADKNDAFWIHDPVANTTTRVNVGPNVIDAVLFGDTDGDGLGDIVTFRLREGNSAVWSVFESVSQSRVTLNAGWGDVTPEVFDIDGDGTDELLAHRTLLNGTERWWYVSTSDPETVTQVDLNDGSVPIA